MGRVPHAPFAPAPLTLSPSSTPPDDQADTPTPAPFSFGQPRPAPPSGQAGAATATPFSRPRVEVPRQENDTERRAATRSWLADERQAGREPDVMDIVRATKLPPDGARQVLADQLAAEQAAAAAQQATQASAWPASLMHLFHGPNPTQR